MRRIPWEQVLGAIRGRDARRLRLLAQESRCEQRRALLLVFADIVQNGPPIVEARAETPPRSSAQRVRVGLRPRVAAGASNGQCCSCSTSLYQANGVSIELRIDHERGSQRIDLFGHIGDGARSPAKLGGKPVLLMSGKNAVARAITDSVGEFHLQCAPLRSLRLCVSPANAAEEIEVPLGGFISRFLLHCGKPASRSAAARAC